jgi:hypothetical protein
MNETEEEKKIVYYIWISTCDIMTPPSSYKNIHLYVNNFKLSSPLPSQLSPPPQPPLSSSSPPPSLFLLLSKYNDDFFA